MTLTEFIKKYKDSYELFDGNGESLRGQCTQICKRWAQVNGWPIPDSGGSNRAVDYKNYGNGYKFIQNTRYGVPTYGDFVIWKGPESEKEEAKKYGHIAIFINGDDELIKCFGQNWPKKSKCHEQIHGYISAEYEIIGWLHYQPPQNAPETPQTPQPNPRYPFTRNLYPGLYNDGDILQLQNYLQQKGYFPTTTPLTGNYLNITKSAVARFQVDNKIVDNLAAYGAGYCGPKTREFINNH